VAGGGDGGAGRRRRPGEAAARGGRQDDGGAGRRGEAAERRLTERVRGEKEGERRTRRQFIFLLCRVPAIWHSAKIFLKF
jgi:hypothetical protein